MHNPFRTHPVRSTGIVVAVLAGVAISFNGAMLGGLGNLLIDGTRGLVHIGEIQELVNDMFEDVMTKGPLANEPCFGVMVRLVDVKLHEDAIHRGPAQVYPAVRDGIREAMRNATPAGP